MTGKVFFVVGDAYYKFADNDHVIIASQLVEKLSEDHDWEGTERIVISQGISEEERSLLIDLISERKLQYINPFETMAPLKETHKKYTRNVLITSPQKLSPKLYQLEFALNNEVDRLSDHVTGQHVGAMLLMEAARQAVVVTLEREYSVDQGTRWGFVLDKFNSEFSNYVFPLPTSMTVRLEETGKSNKHISTILIIDFFQAEKKISTMQLDVNLYKTVHLCRLETRNARQIIELCQSQYSENETERESELQALS